MSKIKVAEVITRLDWGGSPDIVRIICGYLNPEIFDIRLITGWTKYPSIKTREFLNKFKTKTTAIPQLKRNINPINDLSALLKLYLLFRKEKFDIVHTHTAKAGVLGRVAAYLAGSRIIIHTPHGHNFYGYFGPILSKILILIERFVARFTDRIITLTELERKDFIRFKVADAKKVVLIYQGLELEKYIRISNTDKDRLKQTFNIKPDEEIVGMIGRLESIKGPEYFVEAAKEVVKNNARIKFILVGEGSLYKKLESRVEDLGLKDGFIFTGWREDIAEILSILDILVLPSLNEAVGMVLIEAQALGVAVVATNVGGIPEIVRDNQTGILVPPKDPHSLFQAVISLLEDKEKRQRMGEAARSWIDDKFSTETMVNKVSNLYQELMRSEKI